MNKGGFSWRRLLGISETKSKISRAIGIPLTKSGRERKLGAAMGNLVVELFSAAIVPKKIIETKRNKSESVMTDNTDGCNRREDAPNKFSSGIVTACDDIINRILYSTIPYTDIPVTEEERTFIINLIMAMVENQLADEEITLTRLSNKTFNVNCTTCYIGKIKLQNRCYMQVLGVRGGIKNMHNMDLDKCLAQIPSWIRYIKYCRKP